MVTARFHPLNELRGLPACFYKYFELAMTSHRMLPFDGWGTIDLFKQIPG
jgi:hypothetical protein